jgi:hypothetical protein
MRKNKSKHQEPVTGWIYLIHKSSTNLYRWGNSIGRESKDEFNQLIQTNSDHSIKRAILTDNLRDNYTYLLEISPIFDNEWFELTTDDLICINEILTKEMDLQQTRL